MIVKQSAMSGVPEPELMNWKSIAMATAAARFSPLPDRVQAKTAPRRRKSIAVGARVAIGMARRKEAVFIDLRDWEIVDRTGWIEGSFHCPPGEFSNIVSPASPLHARLFEPGKIFIFYGGPDCSPLASAKRAKALGLEQSFALRGGLKAWRNAGGRISGHPNSAFPVLRASLGIATAFARRRMRAWWRGDRRAAGRKLTRV
ncbi:rhodanese-like domain-containing protein [Methylopila sp. M107]|uniref:rhodanese-like domain-containing protein n=1 Tax=Methylopila sp. M107 TaxID=1101190 RepID=UPI000381AD5D|nr:rhodanese-like domain-containing protein [Methylopila sp. M107]